MKKRLLSFLLTGSLLLMLLPTAALAEDTAALSGGEISLTNETISTYVNKDLGDGTYVLSDDITVGSGSLKFSGTASLDLSGHKLTFNAPAETQVRANTTSSTAQYRLNAGIVVYGDMTLTDSSSDNSGVLDVRGEKNVGVLVTPDAKFTMTGGTITNSTPDNNQGIGLAVLGATASMTGGKITGEKDFGVWAAIGRYIPSSFTMNVDAEISDCGAGVNSNNTTGGGICIASNCNLTINGGTITNCAARRGGGVYFGGDTFTMYGGSITNCKAGNGGGVYMAGLTFNLYDGTISGCESNGGGGVFVYGSGSTFTMSSGSITNCSASNGGGVYLENSLAQFLMNGGSITNCKATEEGAGYGGGVLLTNGRFTMNGGEISGCAANEGSSIYLDNATSIPPTFAWSYGTIEGSASLLYQLNGTTCRMEGLGTSAYPYQIENGTQLLLFQSIVNGTNGQTQNLAACAELTDNIDMSSIANFAPIGTETNPYTGTFNGNNHSISGLTINGSDAAGLFGYVKGATIQKINLCNSQITATSDGGNNIYTYAGGIVGFATGAAKIENCSTNNITINAGSRHIGGIIGYGKDSTRISNCTNTSSLAGTYNVGGIAGYLEDSSITNSGNSGNLPAPQASGSVGGIVGFTRNGQISTCYNTGEITDGSDANVGGIVGMSEASSSISDCYNVGAVHGGKFNGGIAGLAIGTYCYCYNTGAVTDSQCRGGVIGHNAGITTIDHCYYLDTAAPVGISKNPQSGVESRTAAEFADGSVLTSLIAGRADGVHPWNPACQYLNATGKTQPVFQQQGDNHNHTGNTWLHDETSHWKVCDCNAVFDKAAHTAAADDGDCTTPVLCKVCGETVTAANAAHTWGAWSSNSDGTHTRRCTTPGCTAGVETETCTDANHDYTCDLCGAALPRPAPTATPTAAPTATPAPTATAAPGRRTESAADTQTAAPTSTPPQPTPRPTATAQPVIPATGDTDAPVLWTVFLFLSGAALLTLTANSKRRKR